MPVITMAPAQEALAATTVLDTPAIVMSPALTAPAATETEHELSIPETVLLVQPSTSESQLGASYLNNYVHHIVQNASISVCSSDSYTLTKTLKVF